MGRTATSLASARIGDVENGKYRRGNIYEALPLFSQKEQLTVAPNCGNLDRTKVCFCVTFKLILLFKLTLHLRILHVS